MSTYVVGDVQGCYHELLDLLEHCHYQPGKDQLWFVGDLVNRGPKSLEVLRFIKDVRPEPVVVLGNHDLHLLACDIDPKRIKPKDTLGAIFTAPDKRELLGWLRHRPLLHHDANLGFTMVHAGIPPQWDLSEALGHAREVEKVLRGGDYREFLQHMYGQKPDVWDESLVGWERIRMITNYLTRMRFCDEQGRLELQTKGKADAPPPGFLPWYQVPKRKMWDSKIVFGHWAALEAKVTEPNIYPTDGGCVWGARLVALRLEDGEYFSVYAQVQ